MVALDECMREFYNRICVHICVTKLNHTVHFACAFYDGRSVRIAQTCSFVFRVVTLCQNFAEVVGAIPSLFNSSHKTVIWCWYGGAWGWWVCGFLAVINLH